MGKNLDKDTLRNQPTSKEVIALAKAAKLNLGKNDPKK